MLTVCVDILVVNSQGKYLLVKCNISPVNRLQCFAGVRIFKFDTTKKAFFHKANDVFGAYLSFNKFISLKENIFSSKVTSLNNIN